MKQNVEIETITHENVLELSEDLSILIVGNARTGKSTLLQNIIDHDIKIPNAHHHHQRYQQPSCQRAYQEAYHAPLHRPGGNQCGTSNGELANAYVVTYQHGRQSNQRQQQ